ncbi:MAG: AAA family ATPase [Thermodesulfobacteriota bacterium]|nr:AAA family ATPase [Thermodesulfobacteriota bacterium]
MIEFLKISSMAIIDEMEVEFSGGLNCITGETGAGKSLVIGALKLLMGSKAGKELVRPDRKKATIEALFCSCDKEITLKREIYPSGRSRCYIDGDLASISRLSRIAPGLINIYGQHQYQDLLDPSWHMPILEDMAGMKRDSINRAWKDLLYARQRLCAMEKEIQASVDEKEEQEFSLKEIRDADISEGMEDRLRQRLDVALSSADLERSSLEAMDQIYSGPVSMTDLCAQTKKILSSMMDHDPEISELYKEMADISARIEGVSLDLRKRMNTYESDPEYIDELEGRLRHVQDLKAKYRTDEPGLLDIARTLEKRLGLIVEGKEQIEGAGQAVENAGKTYENAIRAFLDERAGFSLGLCRRINADLKEMGMSGTKFGVRQKNPKEMKKAIVNDCSPTENLDGEFMITTNVGQRMLPLSRIASGGELSRIMLAIKVQQRALKETTQVFDEIDSGISGQTSIMIAEKLRDISKQAQTIVVTHLHQVASLAQRHIVVSKTSGHNITRTGVRLVYDMDRVMELARMMGGVNPSPTVIKHARELVDMQA